MHLLLRLLKIFIFFFFVTASSVCAAVCSVPRASKVPCHVCRFHFASLSLFLSQPLTQTRSRWRIWCSAFRTVSASPTRQQICLTTSTSCTARWRAAGGSRATPEVGQRVTHQVLLQVLHIKCFIIYARLSWFDRGLCAPTDLFAIITFLYTHSWNPDATFFCFVLLLFFGIWQNTTTLLWKTDDKQNCWTF